MEAKLVHETLDEGLLGPRRPKRITDGMPMDWVVAIIDKIEHEGNIDRDRAISIVETNIDFLRDLYNGRYNTYETYLELIKMYLPFSSLI